MSVLVGEDRVVDEHGGDVGGAGQKHSVRTVSNVNPWFDKSIRKEEARY